MGIARYENISVNNLTFSNSSFGEQTTVQTTWFDTRALVGNVASDVSIADNYRVYQDMINLTLNYTPNMRTIANNQNNYSITYRNKDWRIVNVKESNDRMKVTFMCSYNQPGTAV